MRVDCVVQFLNNCLCLMEQGTVYFCFLLLWEAIKTSSVGVCWWFDRPEEVKKHDKSLNSKCWCNSRIGHRNAVCGFGLHP